MKGSPKYLAKQLMRTVIAKNVTKLSRHEMKAKVRLELEADGITPTQAILAKHMPVYSARTEAGYKKAWEQFFNFAREEHGVRDPAKIKRRHIEEFLQRKINQDAKLKTFKTYAAAISKMELALNNVRKYPLHYSEAVDRMRVIAKQQLNGDVRSRAYKNPVAVVDEIKIEEYKVAAELQMYGGARIAEISELKRGRNLLGIKNGVGVIRLTNTKGGRVRDMSVSVELYKRVEDLAAEDGTFEFSRGNYSRALKRAAERSGNEWQGTHGLRWNYIQNSFRERQEVGGLNYEEALQAVALEIGHSRPEITLHYLR